MSTDEIGSERLDRRGLVKWGATLAAAAGMAGLGGCLPPEIVAGGSSQWRASRRTVAAATQFAEQLAADPRRKEAFLRQLAVMGNGIEQGEDVQGLSRNLVRAQPELAQWSQEEGGNPQGFIIIVIIIVILILIPKDAR